VNLLVIATKANKKKTAKNCDNPEQMTRKPTLIFSKINLEISSATIRRLMVKNVFCGDNFHLHFHVIYEQTP
jgi:hypothetical protein